MSKHTPGPWFVCPAAPWKVVASPTDHALTIARTAALPDDDDEAEAEANARLIAAAPDMLAALRRLLESTPMAGAWKAGVTRVPYTDAEWHELEAATKTALAAIAKAEGREP